MDKRFVAIIILVVGVFVGIGTFGGDNKNAKISSSDAPPTQHIKGAETTGIVLQEFGDFQCSACATYYPLVKQLQDEYGDRLAFQFIHFPLIQIHPNAFVAHKAAEAAGKQNKFFEMHDLLYEQQQLWANANNATTIFENFAAQLELDMEQYKSDAVSSEVNSSITADIKVGQDNNINSTPSFLLNGKKIENPRSLEEFKALIDAEINLQKTNTTGENQ